MITAQWSFGATVWYNYRKHPLTPAAGRERLCPFNINDLIVVHYTGLDNLDMQKSKKKNVKRHWHMKNMRSLLNAFTAASSFHLKSTYLIYRLNQALKELKHTYFFVTSDSEITCRS